jgi:hypothetical protein
VVHRRVERGIIVDAACEDELPGRPPPLIHAHHRYVTSWTPRWGWFVTEWCGLFGHRVDGRPRITRIDRPQHHPAVIPGLCALCVLCVFLFNAECAEDHRISAASSSRQNDGRNRPAAMDADFKERVVDRSGSRHCSPELS